MSVRTEVAVFRAPARPASADRRPGPLVRFCQDQERVALVVPQPHVEAGLVLLDEAVLEHEGLDVVADLDPLDALGRGHHLGGPRQQCARALEVVGQTLAERLGLADVDNPPVLVAELVRAGSIRDRTGGWSFEHNFQCGSPSASVWFLKPSQDHHKAAKTTS